MNSRTNRMLPTGIRRGHNPRPNVKVGKRADLGGQFFRSRSEANYARYLNLLQKQGQILGWEYEPHTFQFESIKRGTRDYTPDFKVYLPNGKHEWHEVKGWMDQKSRTRLKRMSKFFPDEKVVVISSKWFSQARRNGIATAIKHWETA